VKCVNALEEMGRVTEILIPKTPMITTGKYQLCSLYCENRDHQSLESLSPTASDLLISALSLNPSTHTLESGIRVGPGIETAQMDFLAKFLEQSH